MADIVCLTAIGIGIARQTDIIVCTLWIIDMMSAVDAGLPNQPERSVNLCPRADLIGQRAGLFALLHIGAKKEIGV